ncbi:uncharacterized protein [Macrobrachium rosenbergii]|uniref:uncharacterized protein n=1 Tax=Macrobrachium rosenbergii TaxID=79674 RepID=UPI0034D4BA3F
MEAGTLVIRVLAILLQFGALNADDLTQYARCHKNLTSSTGSISEEEFSGLSCPEHEIRIQAGVPIVFTCQDLVLEVGSQQYCVSIGGIKKGKGNKDKPSGFGRHRLYNLNDNDDSNNGGKRKRDRKPQIKSSVNSHAEDGDAPWKRRSKRGSAGRSNNSGNDPAKAIERVTKKLEKMEAKLEQTKALGKERMAQRLTMEIERTKGRLEDLKSNYSQNMAKPKLSNSVKDNKNNKTWRS